MTISPAMNRIFTMSAGDFPTFSAIVWGVAPRTNCITGRVGLGGATATAAGFAATGASGAGGASGAAAAGTSSGMSGTAFTTGFAAGFLALRGAGGGSSTSRRLDVAAVALPPLARSRGMRSSGTLEEADRPVAPICSRVATRSCS